VGGVRLGSCELYPAMAAESVETADWKSINVAWPAIADGWRIGVGVALGVGVAAGTTAVSLGLVTNDMPKNKPETKSAVPRTATIIGM